MKTAIFLAVASVWAGASSCTCSGSEPRERDHAAAPAPPASPLAVPRLQGALELDGETTEPAWRTAARTMPFEDASGGEARPFSEAHFLWDTENLYVLLYAADNDIRARVSQHDGPVWIDDHFTLHLTPWSAAQAPVPESAPTYTFHISPAGVVMDAKRAPGQKDDPSWESGITLGVDRDGEINEDSRDDEEWVIEAAIPLRSMGVPGKVGTRVQIDIARCDTPLGTREKRCGAWGSPEAPHTLELAP